MRHKWVWAEGYTKAKCSKCGAKIVRRVRKSTRTTLGETTDDFFIYPNGDEVKLGATPPCEPKDG